MWWGYADTMQCWCWQKLDQELASAVEASHFDARWSGNQKKQMDGNCLCVQIQTRQ